MEGWVDLGYPAMQRPGVELGISGSRVQCPNHYTTPTSVNVHHNCKVQTASNYLAVRFCCNCCSDWPMQQNANFWTPRNVTVVNRSNLHREWVHNALSARIITVTRTDVVVMVESKVMSDLVSQRTRSWSMHNILILRQQTAMPFMNYSVCSLYYFYLNVMYVLLTNVKVCVIWTR